MTIDVKSKAILSNLKSTDPEFLLETIEKVRESGNRFILAGLIDLLHDTDLPEIKKSILNLLSELKNKESVPVFIEAIKSEKYAGERKYLVAFEAFTVIENMFGRIEDEIIDKEIIKITDALKNATEHKAYLLNGLLSIIRDIPEEQEFSD